MDRKRVEEILNQFPGKTILIVGDVMLDEFIWGRSLDFSRSARAHR
jgi:bifunctional ADP-heptose synthase (sugar kinase/adenylyltransferase)